MTEQHPITPLPELIALMQNEAGCYDPRTDVRHGMFTRAAALRAAADQVVPPCSTQSDRGTQRMMIHHKLLAIAAELKVQP